MRSERQLAKPGCHRWIFIPGFERLLGLQPNLTDEILSHHTRFAVCSFLTSHWPIGRGCLCSPAGLARRAECLRAQQSHVTVSKVRTSRKELGDCAELMGIETFQQRSHIFSYWLEHGVDVSHPLPCWVEDLLTPVVRVRF